MLRRACGASDTLALVRNLAPLGVYVLHGERDDNVPVEQARMMRRELAAFHGDFAYYERPGAGHWWGNECVDWPPLVEFLRERARPAEHAVPAVSFVTASPGVSDRCHWLSIEAQQRDGLPARAELSLDAARRRFTGSTGNVARLVLHLEGLAPGGPLSVELDGETLKDLPWPEGEPVIRLARDDGASWRPVPRPDPGWKGPHRYGPFKDGFRHRFLLVYGTRGDAAENAWAAAKARYDAEVFWYRGNGSVDVLSDEQFLAAETDDRSVILYGNARTNGAWAELLGRGPVQVEPGRVVVGGSGLAGGDLAALFIRPRPGSDVASVAAVSGTGIAGMRLTDRLPYFVSGVGYPDLLVLESGALAAGSAGVVAAGYFGPDWSVERGEVELRAAAPARVP
jgi:hypothetical protein